MSILEGVGVHYRLFGLYGVLLVAKARVLGRPLEVVVAVDGISHVINLRLRTTDVSLFDEIILNSEYSFEPARPPQIIVDAGANIGMTSVFYANKFPGAKIIAIEPEEANFEMLKKNAAHYSNIVPVRGSSGGDAELTLSNPGTGEWGYQTREKRESDTPGGSVRGMTVDKLMEQYSCDYIDILKMDIEGAEKEVFETSGSWIDRVGTIIVESHDRLKTGCSRSIYSATKDFELEWCKGETTFFVRKEYAPSGSLQASASTEWPDTLSILPRRRRRSRITSSRTLMS